MRSQRPSRAASSAAWVVGSPSMVKSVARRSSVQSVSRSVIASKVLIVWTRSVAQSRTVTRRWSRSWRIWLSQMLSTVPTLAPSQLPWGVTCASIRSRMPISMMMPSSSGRLLTCSLVIVRGGGGIMPLGYHSIRTWHPKYANHKYQVSSITHLGENTMPERLFHFSDDPGITRFEPRPPPSASSGVTDNVVWAVGGRLRHNYLLPRDCPRVTFYPAPSSTPDDVARLMAGTSAGHVVTIETGWMPALRQGRLYQYQLP